MDASKAIKIDPSTFKFIAVLDIFSASFVKDDGLFPMSDDMSDVERGELNAKASEYVSNIPYCSPYSISIGDRTPRRFEYKGKFMEFSPSKTGLPTIRDFDILIYCGTWIANAAMDGRDDDVGAVYQLDVEDFYKFSGRAQNGEREDNFIEALDRLTGSGILTNTTPIGLGADSFSYVEKYQLGRDNMGRLKTVTLQIPHRFYCLAHNEFFFEIHPDFFVLSNVRRIIYLFLKQFCGGEDDLTVTFAKLHAITGAISPLRKFMLAIKEMVERPLPEYEVELNQASETVTVYSTKGDES